MDKKLVWHHMGNHELAQTVRSNLIVWPGTRGGFDLFDSASLLGHHSTKVQAQAAAERYHRRLLKANEIILPPGSRKG